MLKILRTAIKKSRNFFIQLLLSKTNNTAEVAVKAMNED
jgi:hypothetical protein